MSLKSNLRRFFNRVRLIFTSRALQGEIDEEMLIESSHFNNDNILTTLDFLSFAQLLQFMLENHGLSFTGEQKAVIRLVVTLCYKYRDAIVLKTENGLHFECCFNSYPLSSDDNDDSLVCICIKMSQFIRQVEGILSRQIYLEGVETLV